MVYACVDVNKLEKAAENGKKTAKLALNLANNYERTIASALFGNNLVNILASSILALVGAMIDPNVGSTVAAIIFTIVIIIFGEFFPKAIAKRFSYSFALAFAYPLRFFNYLFAVITWPVGKLFELVSKLFKKKSEEEDQMDEDDLDQIVDAIEESGELEEDEAEIVRGAIDIADIQAFEIMTPRVDVFAINIADDINQIIEEMEIFTYTRVPVYEDTIDNIIGILPLKTLSRAILSGEHIDVRSLLVKPIVIPRNTQVLDLLEIFKKSKVHIAIVIDEYGGVEGVVTMEDILEEIVGDIFDETDEIEEEYIEKRNGVWIVDGSMNLDDFFELIDFKDEFETDYSTVAGFCQEFKQGFLKEDDSFEFSHYRVTVLEADDFTVEKIRVDDIEEKRDND